MDPAPSVLWILVLASAASGLAVGLVAWSLGSAATPDATQDDEWRYDRSRRANLAELDWVVRFFPAGVNALAAVNRAIFPQTIHSMERELQAAGLPRFWLAEEYLAKGELIALALLPLATLMTVQMIGPVGWVLGPLVALALAFWQRRHLALLARQRLAQIKRRLPFMLDLLTLLMDAGATFLGALRQATAEFAGHPIAVEFGRVLADIHLGKTRVEAFQALRRRLADDEISAITAAILQGEELGTPLASVFRTQADVLRVKRTQRAETLAHEAAVNMLLPGVLVMMAAVLIILGPFAINYLFSGFLP